MYCARLNTRSGMILSRTVACPEWGAHSDLITSSAIRSLRELWIVLICLLSPLFAVQGADNKELVTNRTSRPGAELFASDPIPELVIQIDPEDVEKLRKSPRNYVHSSVLAGGRKYPNVAVHLKGSTGSFRPIDDKPGFTLFFSKFEQNQRFHGLSKIHLNNSVEDPSYANEAVGAELFRQAGIPAPRVTRALVQLNDRKLGLYVLKEGFTEEFLAGYFQRTDGPFYDRDATNLTDDPAKRGLDGSQDSSDLIALAKAAQDFEHTRHWQRLGQALDIDRFIDFMAMEVMIGHRDGYCLARNNFRIYYDPGSDRMVFLPHGMDQLFGSAELPWNPSMSGTVAKVIMSVPEGCRNYEDRFRLLFDRVYKVNALNDFVDRLVAQLRSSLNRDDFHAVEREALLFKDRIARRQTHLKWQLSQPKPKPLDFNVGQARLGGWMAVDEPRGGKVEQIENSVGKSTLHIVAGPETSASWRTKALLKRGLYRFEGKGKIANVKPLPFGKYQGAGLRIAGKPRQSVSFVGNSDWQDLGIEFDVKADVEVVEFICELRASSGELWIQQDSLCVKPVDSSN